MSGLGSMRSARATPPRDSTDFDQCSRATSPRREAEMRSRALRRPREGTNDGADYVAPVVWADWSLSASLFFQHAYAFTFTLITNVGNPAVTTSAAAIRNDSPERDRGAAQKRVAVHPQEERAGVPAGGDEGRPSAPAAPRDRDGMAADRTRARTRRSRRPTRRGRRIRRPRPQGSPQRTAVRPSFQPTFSR